MANPRNAGDPGECNTGPRDSMTRLVKRGSRYRTIPRFETRAEQYGMAKNAKMKSGTKKSAAKAAPIRKGGKSALVEPQVVKGSDVDPNHQWKRPLQAPGHTQVDFEERVDFRRLHNYRLARTRAALANSGLGALLCFDQHNIRYITSTVIGEWARDKLT